MTKIKVGLVQNFCGNDVSKNLEKAISGIKKAASKGANIVCLQELFCSMYFCDVESHQNFDLAEAIPGKTTSILQEIAKENDVVIIASLFEKRSAGFFQIPADGRWIKQYFCTH